MQEKSNQNDKLALNEIQKNADRLRFKKPSSFIKSLKEKKKSFTVRRSDLGDLVYEQNSMLKLSSKDFKVTSPNRYVGVEIELSKAGLRKLDSPSWENLAAYCSAVKNDGSVRGDGMELNTIPSRGSAFHKQMSVISKSLRTLRAKADNSCGLHVHVDASDYKGKDAFKLAFLWSLIENEMYLAIPQDRRSSRYAAPMAPQTKERILRARHRLSDVHVRQVVGRFNMYDRYRGLNFTAYSEDRPTFEFRLHEGTSNGKEITLWAMVCANIVSFAKNKSVKYIRDLANVHPSEILQEIVAATPFLLDYINERKESFKVGQV